MDNERTIEETSIEPYVKVGTYSIWARYSQEAVITTALGLLEIHDYVEEHRERLEQEAVAHRERLAQENG